MHRNKLCILFFSLILGAGACINPFDPGIDPQDISKYVVNGVVSDESAIQTVSVSMASSVGDPRIIPVSGCSVIIRDEPGNIFQMNEAVNGIYKAEIDPSFLVAGNSFRIEVTTPDGTMIQSDFDSIPGCPDVDSVYFLRSEIIADNPNDVVKGIRFYLDFDGGSSASRYFRWELEETWEYRVPYPREWFYDGIVHQILPADYSRQVCWKTVPVWKIFTLSTAGLSENRYEMLPLNFVDNLGPRLVYGYSLLIKQISLSEASFAYWDQLRSNSYDQGGLYDKQPAMITGNLHNMTSPDNEVLGFFGASSVKSKRIFVADVDNLDIKYTAPCSLNILKYGFKELKPEDLPVYLYGDRLGYSLISMGDECVDCLKMGGVNVKPDFWPW
ncbi:MAG TPA: DUF4249 domain-containing protein [Bacteroidales bacterium]|nr:DUF4249 domain-containing protein [Bacteroidales bacterium]